MKIIILGGEGMLGHKMFQILSARYPETSCTLYGALRDPFYQRVDLFRMGRVHDRVNAQDFPRLQSFLQEIKPDFIINCIGIIKQRQEARMAVPTIGLNSLLPHLLGEWARGWKGRVIHFSTDCVFSGKKGSYIEEDFSDAEDLYGKSKFLGEVATENALTLRTSIIGRELSQFQSLLEWFLAQEGQAVKGFTRVIYSGVTTNYMAGLVGDLIRDHPGLGGLYQVTAPSITKHELLIKIRDAFGLKIEVIPDDREVSDRSMLGNKFRDRTGYPEPDWDSLSRQLASDPTPYGKWR